MYTIYHFFSSAQCEMSGKEGECVEVSCDDGSLNHSLLSIKELTKLLRFRERQELKKNSSQSPASSR